MNGVPSPPWGEGGEREHSERKPGEGEMNLRFAKKLRQQMTAAERRLWYRLRARRFGKKVKRQVPIGPYIVDFACLRHKLIIELDGGQHADNAQDVERDAWLEQCGYRVLRFWNHDVLKQIGRALDYGASDAPLPARSARHPLPDGERGP